MLCPPPAVQRTLLAVPGTETAVNQQVKVVKNGFKDCSLTSAGGVECIDAILSAVDHPLELVDASNVLRAAEGRVNKPHSPYGPYSPYGLACPVARRLLGWDPGAGVW